MNMVSIVILLYEVYLWVVFVNFYQPFLKKSIYARIEYLLTVFCHYHYMIVAVIHAITLFTILYFFHNRIIARRFRIVYIYLLTQVVLRLNHETPPAYAGGIILGQAKLVLNLRVLDILYSAVSLPHLPLRY